METMTRKELLNFINYQLKTDLKEDKKDLCNSMFEGWMHIEIPREQQYNVLTLLNNKNIQHTEHLNNTYFIRVVK